MRPWSERIGRWGLLAWLLVRCVLMQAAVPPLDSLMNIPVMAMPVISHSPETGWEFGAAAQGWFRTMPQAKPSIVNVGGAWSLNRQWFVHGGGVLYFGSLTDTLPHTGKHWMVRFNGGYRYYPDIYYGRGNTLTSPDGRPGIGYLSRRGVAQVEALAGLPHHWWLGPAFHFLHEQTDSLRATPTDANILTTTRMWGLGAVVQYDTRDILFYPTRGMLFKASLLHYEPALGADCRLTALHADLRQYLALGRGFIFAWQFRTDWALGNSSELPFQLLPTLGGQDLIRGVRRNMFRDNAMMALQGELRIPLWNFLRACVFAGIGDVYDTADWQWTMPKVGYGLGLRMSINRAKVNLRFDIARNNYDNRWNNMDSWSFYLSATEAF
ncbi:MAG: BamA/TamA family outer membrane protein [Paludibacteraceae bacterium]|nr:BamA/TamA family outer membrane protein [Paludibacteraceae bacterium]